MRRNRPIFVSNHVVVDRADRLDAAWSARDLEALIRRFGRVGRRAPEGVHQGKHKSDAWCVLDTGRSSLAFPLVAKTGRDGQRLYLATTVVRRRSDLSGVRRIWRRLRVARA